MSTEPAASAGGPAPDSKPSPALRRVSGLSGPRRAWLVPYLFSGAVRKGMAHLRGVVLRLLPGLYFRSVGSGTMFFGWPLVPYWGTDIRLGERCAIGAKVHFLAGKQARITLGKHVFINDHSFLLALDEITIGDGTAIAEFVAIRDHDHRFGEGADVHGDEYLVAPVRIGANVWIAHGVVVVKGVTIGDGAVIGANSVVTRDIPSHCVAVGAPARVIRRLTPPPS